MAFTAAAAGPAQWAAPLTNNRMLWDEKFIGPPPLGNNPFAQVEFKSERTHRVATVGLGGSAAQPAELAPIGR